MSLPPVNEIVSDFLQFFLLLPVQAVGISRVARSKRTVSPGGLGHPGEIRGNHRRDLRIPPRSLLDERMMGCPSAGT